MGLELSAEEPLRITRRAENDFVGARTGGMDQPRAEAAAQEVADAFARQGFGEPASFIAHPAAGAHRVE